jgi:3D (Asp-Asp-Asp) domain-containing protein
MNRKIAVGFAKLLVISLCWSTPVSSAQEQTAAKTQAESVDKSTNAYRLDFTINEIEDGKKINARQYSMNLNAGDANTIKIGTRVPVEAKQGEFQYIDVGTSIWSRVKERDNGLAVEVRAEISNFAIPDQAGRINSMPLLRQMQINASTVTMPGRSTVVGSVDDPTSKRQFQLEVTVTRLK